jgi:predicted TIM-barrel fold metal-dependent hydrolase
MEMEKNEMQRRDFVKAATFGAAAFVTSIPGMALSDSLPGAKPEAEAPNGKKYKVIDYRCRPPLKQFGGLYQLRLGYIAQRPNVLANPATHGEVPKAIKMFGEGDAGAFDEWWKEIDNAGIESVVVAGRFMLGQPAMSMGTEELLNYEKKYQGRFYGIAPINIDQATPKAVEELEKAINAGIRGATIEPGYRTVGGPTSIDDIAFYPLYELLQEKGILLQVQTGAFADPNNFDLPNEIWRMDSVMKQFPKLRLVLGHGGYPRITEALALALKWPSVTISSDVYTFWPGGQLYQQNIELLQDQFVYGSAYPFGNFKETLEQTLALPLSEQVMEKYLYLNARKLLNLD